MGFLSPDVQQPQIQSPPEAPPPPAPVGNTPTGKKPKTKSTIPSFLGTETSPDSTSLSNKTLLGQ